MIDISIIIPCYNSSATIEASIESVLGECKANNYTWEVIVVDDGSSDNSAQLVEKIEGVKLIKQPNGGAAVARNTGIKAAQGDFIAFNDSDDKWLEGKLKMQMEYMRENSDVVMCAGVYSKHNMASIKALTDFNTITIKDQVLKNYFSPPTTMIRRSVLEKSGLFNANRRYLEEGWFFNNVVYCGRSILINKIVSAPVVDKFIYGDSGLSGNVWKMECGELFNIKEAYRLRYISFGLYFKASCFSLLKFFRRFVISKIR